MKAKGFQVQCSDRCVAARTRLPFTITSIVVHEGARKTSCMDMTAASIDANVCSPIAACPASCRIFHFGHRDRFALFGPPCCVWEASETSNQKVRKLVSTCSKFCW
mmetsp:Transcript_7024/g.16422  ORF Transcript_7024/g.16422 Transcript_7024/m.16422 type:complete len:106 (+) Transcript_7024:2367-2684(+)